MIIWTCVQANAHANLNKTLSLEQKPWRTSKQTKGSKYCNLKISQLNLLALYAENCFFNQTKTNLYEKDCFITWQLFYKIEI